MLFFCNKHAVCLGGQGRRGKNAGICQTLRYVQVHITYRDVYMYLYVLMRWQGIFWHFLASYIPLVSWKQQLMGPGALMEIDVRWKYL